MPISYTNRCGDTYYVFSPPRRRGPSRYFTTLLPTRFELLDALPPELEFVEFVKNGNVVVRERVPTLVHPREVEQVRAAIARAAGVRDFLVCAEGNEIVVYLSQYERADGVPLVPSAEEVMLKQPDVYLRRKYFRQLRFLLADAHARTFDVWRQHVIWRPFHAEFRMLEDGVGELEELCERVCPHLGRSSWLELAIVW